MSNCGEFSSTITFQPLLISQHLSFIYLLTNVKILIDWHCFNQKVYFIMSFDRVLKQNIEISMFWFGRSIEDEKKSFNCDEFYEPAIENRATTKWRQNITSNMGWKASVMEKVLAKYSLRFFSLFFSRSTLRLNDKYVTELALSIFSSMILLDKFNKEQREKKNRFDIHLTPFT